jgi:sarcosine oxidase subunit alpha
MVDWRIYEHPILEFDRGEEVTIYLDGKPMKAFESETVAAALYANGLREFSKSIKYRRPRGFFCAIGRCSACMMEVDGVPNVRTCIVMAKDGMQIKRHRIIIDSKFPRTGSHINRRPVDEIL